MTTIEKSERNEMILISVQKYNYRVLLAVCIEQCVQLYMCFVAPVWLCDVCATHILQIGVRTRYTIL